MRRSCSEEPHAWEEVLRSSRPSRYAAVLLLSTSPHTPTSPLCIERLNQPKRPAHVCASAHDPCPMAHHIDWPCTVPAQRCCPVDLEIVFRTVASPNGSCMGSWRLQRLHIFPTGCKFRHFLSMIGMGYLSGPTAVT